MFKIKLIRLNAKYFGFCCGLSAKAEVGDSAFYFGLL